MKILHIIDHFGLGGAQKIASMIVKNDKESELYVLRRTDYQNILLKKVFIYNSKNKFSLSPIKDISSLIKEKNIKILHCHLLRSKFIGYLIKKIYNPEIKLIFHEHSKLSSNFLYKFFLFLSVKEVDLHIAVSKEITNQLNKIKFINQDKIIKLNNCVSLFPASKKAVSEFRKKFQVKNNLFTIGFVGRLHSNKGCDLLIRSVSLLDFPFQLIIVGDGKELECLKKIAMKLKLEKKVIFTGAIYETSPAYKCLDVLVSPSKNETFGLTVLEAQMSGVPVIASKTFEGVISSENSLIIEQLRATEIAHEIKKLFNLEKLRVSLIEEGLINVKKYSKEKYLKIIKGLYKNIL